MVLGSQQTADAIKEALLKQGVPVTRVYCVDGHIQVELEEMPDEVTDHHFTAGYYGLFCHAGIGGGEVCGRLESEHALTGARHQAGRS